MTDFTLTPGPDSFKGSKADDEFILNTDTDLAAGDKITGGGGNDQIVFKDNNTGTLVDAAFAGVTQVQTITVDHVQGFITLGALAAKAGINTVDGLNASDTLQVDASGYTNAAGITIKAHVAANFLTGSGFGDTFEFSVADLLTIVGLPAPTDIDGGAGNDTLKLNDLLNVTLTDAAFAGFANVERILGFGPNLKTDLGVNAAAAGIILVDGTSIDDTLEINASAYTKDGLVVKAGAVISDYQTITGSDFNDAILIKNGGASGTFHGGKDSGGFGDVLGVYGDGKTTVTVTDAVFADVDGIETLRPIGSANANITIGEKATAAGLDRVDGAGITGTLTVVAKDFSGGIEIVAGAGNAVLTGGAGNDSFVFTSKTLTNKDVVDGAGVGDDDRIVITDKAAVVDAAFAKVTHVETLTFSAGDSIGDFSGAKVVLGALSVNAKIATVENDTNYALTLDAGARATGVTFDGGFGDDVFIASKGADTFNGGGGDDSLRMKVAGGTFGDDSFDGGAGTDEFRILDSVVLHDGDLAGFTSVERLVFDGTGKQSAELGTAANAAGIAVIDASKVSGGFTLDASGDQHDLAVYAGTGADHILMGGTKGSVNDLYITSTKLTAADTLTGDSVQDAQNNLHFTDSVKLTDAYFATNTANVTNFYHLLLDGMGAGQSLVAGAKFVDFLVGSSVRDIDATSTASTTSFTFDFSGVTDLKTSDFSSISGSGGNDVFIGGPVAVDFLGEGGDDIFKSTTANFITRSASAAGKIDGGDGSDTIVLTDAGTLVDTDFKQIVAVETLQLGATKTGTYSLTLGTANFDLTGIATIDGSKAGVTVTINASQSKNDLTVLAGGKDNTIATGEGDDTIAIDAKTLNGLDSLDGGAKGADALRLSTGGVVSASGFAGAKQFEILQLADAGNSVVLSDTLISGSSGNVSAVIGAHAFRGFNFIVAGSKGNDAVDLSSLTNGGIGVFAGGGSDTFIGSTFHDVFMFANPGDLTAADKVNGGAGEDEVVSVAGAYSTDLFKGFKGIENFTVFDGDFAKGSAITVKNDFLQTLSADASGHRVFSVTIDDAMTGDDTVDASAVTGALNSVVVSTSRGEDSITGGAGNDVFGFVDDGNGHFNLDSDDTIVGGGGFDTIDLNNEESSNPAVLADADLSGVTGVEQLTFHSGSNNPINVTLDQNAAAAGIVQVDASDLSVDFGFDAAFYGNSASNGVTLLLGTGNDDITLSGNDDIIRLTHFNSDLDGTDTVEAGGGTDTIQFEGSDDITDTPFLFVDHIEVAALMGAAHKITTDKFADASGLQRIDAAQAQQSVAINAAAMNNALTIYGSSFADTIGGTKGSDVIVGGSGKDTMTGNGGNDTYGFFSSDDSRLGANGDLSHVDLITDYNAGDRIAVNPLQTTQTVVVATPGDLVTADTADFFKNGGIVAQFDAKTGLTNVYINNDLDGGTGFEIDKDIVFQISGDHAADVALPSFFTDFAHPGALRPELTENNVLALPTAKTYNDSDPEFAGKSNKDALVLSATKGDYTLNLGVVSDAAGFRLIDGSKVTGTLTVDASDRSDPVYIASGAAVNDLTGTAGDDVFYFTSAGLTAKDKVNGGLDGKLLFTGSDQDTLFITDKAALVDAAFTGVKNIEILEFGPNPLPGATEVDVTGQKVVLGAKSEAATIGTIINDHATGLTVDASSRDTLVTFIGGIGNDVLYGTKGPGAPAFSSDIFEGGAGDDSFRNKIANLGGQNGQLDTFNGGAGTDELRILDSYDVKNDAGSRIGDLVFQGFTSVERLVFDGTGKQIVTLESNADDAGLAIIDASKVAGGLILDVTNMSNDLAVFAGTGADQIQGGGGNNDIYFLSGKLTAADTVDGGNNGILHFTDAVKLTDANFAGLTKNVTNIGSLDLDSAAKGQTFTAGDNFAAFVTTSQLQDVTATSSNPAASITYDFTKYTGPSLTAYGSAGKDVFKAGVPGVTFDGNGGDDSFQFTATNFSGPIFADGGNDEIVILDAGTVNVAVFSDVHSVETLRFAAAKSGIDSITLNTDTDGAGIVKVDAALAGVEVKIDGSLSHANLTLIAGSKANTLTGGDGNDIFVLDAKTFGADDTIGGGASTKGDTLLFTMGGVISAAAFAANQVHGIEIVQLAGSGNSLTVTDAMVAQSDKNGLAPNHAGAGAFDFIVEGGKGSDTVDLSAVTAGASIAVVAGTGADKLTGSAGDDTFYFDTGDFSSNDVVKGGAGHDTLDITAEDYGADAFKNLTSIEAIFVFDNGVSPNTVIKVSDLAFKGADLLEDGSHQLSFVYNSSAGFVLDASAIANTANDVSVSFAAGDDTFKGGAGADVVNFTDDGGSFFALTGFDQVDGGLGRDTIVLETDRATSILLDTALAGVNRVEALQLFDSAGKGGSSITVNLSDNAMAAGIDLVDGAGTRHLSVEATLFDDDLTVLAGEGATDDYAFGAGNATVVFGPGSALDAGDKLTGGTGSNTVQFAGGATILDSQFAKVSDFSTIALVDGTFSLTLGDGSDFADTKAGINTIDASKAGHGATIDVSAMTNAVAITGSAGNDTISATKGGGEIIGGSGGDALIANTGNDHFVYTSTGDSVLRTGNDTSHMDEIDGFADGQNDTIDLMAFGFIGTPVVTTKTSLAEAVSDGFTSGAVALFEVGGTDTYVFADTNKNGTFDFDSDLVIKVVGLHGAALAAGDLQLSF